MKLILAAVLVLGAASTSLADAPRDTKKEPLSSREWRAYRASKSLAKENGFTIHPSCVFSSDEEGYSVTVGFFEPATKDSEAECGDLHYSIEVEIDENDSVTSISVKDS